MNSVWVKPTEELPFSGFFVNCDEGPYLFVSYGSYQDILNFFNNVFSPRDLSLLLWKRQCECNDCDTCEAAQLHEEEHINVLCAQIRVGTHGWKGFNEMEQLVSTSDTNVWFFAQLYQAAHTKIHRYPVSSITDQEARDLLIQNGTFYRHFTKFSLKRWASTP